MLGRRDCYTPNVAPVSFLETLAPAVRLSSQSPRRRGEVGVRVKEQRHRALIQRQDGTWPPRYVWVSLP